MPTASVGLVTVAQALHWFDIEKFFVEAQRVLVPTGVLAFWCYGLCHIADGLDDLLVEIYSFVDEYWPPERDIVDNKYRDIVAPFPSVNCPSFSMQAEWTVEQMLAYLRTWSASQAFKRTTGKDAIIDFEGPLRQLWGQQTRIVSWPLTLQVCRRHPS